MKKLILLSVATLAVLCSCTKNEAYDPDLGVDLPILFQAYDFASQTKAGEPTAFTGENFAVFGYQHAEAWATAKTQTSATAKPSLLMGDVEVRKSGTSNAWAPVTTYYWPKKDMLTFGAYAPKDKGGASFDIEKGIKFATFSVEPVPGTANKVDLLYSDTASDRTYANSNASSDEASMSNADGVYLLFHHALAKVGVSAKYNGKCNPGTEASIKITGIKFAAIDTKGENFDATGKTWTTSVPATQDMGVSNVTLSAEKASTLVNDYYVMPQTLAASTEQILVSYEITTTFNDGTTKTEIITDKAVDFKCTQIQNWDPNHVYTYALNISAVSDDPITFDPAVAPWEKGNSETTIN